MFDITSFSFKRPGLAERIINILIENRVIVRGKPLDIYLYIFGIFISFLSKTPDLAYDIIDELIKREYAVSRKPFDFKLKIFYFHFFFKRLGLAAEIQMLVGMEAV